MYTKGKGGGFTMLNSLVQPRMNKLNPKEWKNLGGHVLFYFWWLQVKYMGLGTCPPKFILSCVFNLFRNLYRIADFDWIILFNEAWSDFYLMIKCVLEYLFAYINDL